jgi:hypothetical protein
MPAAILRFLLLPRSRYVLAWLVAVGAIGGTFWVTWHAFDPPKHADGTPKRRGGNRGHTTIDFGGQWLLGRMLVQGLGPHLYRQADQREILRAAYPQDEETPYEDQADDEKGQHEADSLIGWMISVRNPESAAATASFLSPLAAPDAFAAAALALANQEQVETRVKAATAPRVGGPLYPPIHAMFMYPLGRLRPALAYRIVQIVSMVLALVAAWAVWLLSEGRIWWPVAIAGIVLYPSFAACVNLGQNSVFMLTLLLWGWTCITRDRPIWGGILWGFLAFKPVWAAAFFLVPLLTGRWRVCLAMLGTGTLLALATLPLVGWESWLDWLRVGRQATLIYHADENWVFISRDLLNIPRRWLLDFSRPYLKRDNLAAQIAGWSIFLPVVGLTVLVTLWRKDRQRVLVGPAAAFLLLGAWMSCFHFMYYDVLLTALPVFALLAEPRNYLRPVLVGIMPIQRAELGTSLGPYYERRLPSGYPGTQLLLPTTFRHLAVLNSLTLSLLVLLVITEFLFPLLDISFSVSMPGLSGGSIPMPLKYSTGLHGTPWNTFTLIVLWLWCGWLWLRQPQRQTQSAPGQTPPADRSALVAPVDAAQLV